MGESQSTSRSPRPAGRGEAELTAIGEKLYDSILLDHMEEFRRIIGDPRFTTEEMTQIVNYRSVSLDCLSCASTKIDLWDLFDRSTNILNIIKGYWDTPLMVALYKSRPDSVVLTLLENGADIDYQVSSVVLNALDFLVLTSLCHLSQDQLDGATALHMVSQSGRLNVVKALLNLGANIEATDKASIIFAV